jgi:hypothetical protein
MLDLLVWMAERLFAGLGRTALILWAFMTGVWLGMRREWEERDRHLRDPRPSTSHNAPNAWVDCPDANPLQPGEASAKVTSEANENNVVILAERPNR